jgi:hypothetical protein
MIAAALSVLNKSACAGLEADEGIASKQQRLATKELLIARCKKSQV